MNQPKEAKCRLKIMRNEIIKTSRYQALIISRYYMSICLGVSFLILALAGYTVSALYIFLILNIMPSILSYIIKDVANNRNHVFLKSIVKETPFLLGNLKKVYHYTKLTHIANAISYVVALLLLLLWQYNYTTRGGIQATFTYLPTGILFSSVILRILCFFWYVWKLPYDLSHNKLWLHPIRIKTPHHCNSESFLHKKTAGNACGLFYLSC